MSYCPLMQTCDHQFIWISKQFMNSNIIREILYHPHSTGEILIIVAYKYYELKGKINSC